MSASRSQLSEFFSFMSVCLHSLGGGAEMDLDAERKESGTFRFLAYQTGLVEEEI